MLFYIVVFFSDEFIFKFKFIDKVIRYMFGFGDFKGFF